MLEDQAKQETGAKLAAEKLTGLHVKEIREKAWAALPPSSTTWSASNIDRRRDTKRSRTS